MRTVRISTYEHSCRSLFSILLLLSGLVFSKFSFAFDMRLLPGSDADWNVAQSLLDVIDQSTSYKLTGDDWHSHARKVLHTQHGQRHSPEERIRDRRLSLCSDKQGQDQWLDLQCLAYMAVDRSKYCTDERCVAIALADFVRRDSSIMESVSAALKQPCAHIPKAETLRQRHGVQEPMGFMAIQGPFATEHWLFCDTKEQVTADLQQHNDSSVYTITWRRQKSKAK